MFKKNKDKEFAIIGLGRFGSSLARRLETLGHPVLGLDIDPHVAKAIADEITEAVVLDATDEDALRQVDIAAFQTVIVAIADSFETNALITSTLKKLDIRAHRSGLMETIRRGAQTAFFPVFRETENT